jgi:hypothetical protein
MSLPAPPHGSTIRSFVVLAAHVDPPANSAIAQLCARPKADCSKGIVSLGISQGSDIASVTKNYDSRSRAAYLVSNVITPSFYKNSSCLKDSATVFTRNQERAVQNGQVSDGKADHCYLLNSGCSGTSIDSIYDTRTTEPWAAAANLDWVGPPPPAAPPHASHSTGNARREPFARVVIHSAAFAGFTSRPGVRHALPNRCS